jgi:membrane-associated phospholipid phosphatase
VWWTAPVSDARVGSRMPFAHAGAVAVAAGLMLSLALVVAFRDPVPSWELELTLWINGAGDGVATAMYPVMQLGTAWAPIGVAALIAAFTRDWWLALTTAVVGVGAWLLAKVVKDVIERGRPLEYLPEIVVREGLGTGLGFVSGHSAVAAATALCATAALPPRWRWLGIVLAAAVGIARVVHGVHLAVDVIGGWSLGVLVAMGAIWCLDRVAPRASTSDDPTPA